jgi:hypothetical protein
VGGAESRSGRLRRTNERRAEEGGGEGRSGIGELGLVPARAQPLEPEVEARIAFTRRDFARAMPPTRRRVREARTISSRTPIDATTVFCDHRTGAEVDPVPLLDGEDYWTTRQIDRIATIDVAAVDNASLRALDSAPRAVDLYAFLARELQYGPLDVPAARKTLLRGWLESRDAISLEAGEVAVKNSQLLMHRRTRRPLTWTAWPADPRILIADPPETPG